MKKLPDFLTFFGLGIISLSIIIFLLTFYPVLLSEFKYDLKSLQKTGISETKPVDENFGIVIPKINADSKVISDVDPYNSKEYQVALTKGVAQAKGTAFPGQVGNVFIFSHSSVNFYEAIRFNSVFYLLDKLEKGDDIYLYYQKQKFHYKVTEKKIVEASEVQYMNRESKNKIVTLMTCWPPGTTFKRLIIIGEM